MNISLQALTIRPGTFRDVTAVGDLLARSYPALLKGDYAPSVMVTALPIISRPQPHLIGCGSYFVAERDSAILGAGGWTSAPPQGQQGPAHLGHVRHVVTDHRAVRCGIGRALMEQVMEHARAAGVNVLHCQSTLTAVPFYAALGFETISKIEVRLRPGILFPAVHMRVAL